MHMDDEERHSQIPRRPEIRPGTRPAAPCVPPHSARRTLVPPFFVLSLRPYSNFSTYSILRVTDAKYKNYVRTSAYFVSSRIRERVARRVIAGAAQVADNAAESPPSLCFVRRRLIIMTRFEISRDFVFKRGNRRAYVGTRVRVCTQRAISASLSFCRLPKLPDYVACFGYVLFASLLGYSADVKLS
ncbi:hypothetical protein EVAR_79773_1 [Eumeta japonica]|uniref:Uncharacterized protein n=1 Tax=Eumeta variegata TaxID=151549 RepID=A0A4C1TCI5_EUMVA|nr:hypothetical protein EVAR_79773_1 [Eumeta japonica]